jgi:predicted porin
MKKFLPLLLSSLLTTGLFAYTDSDMDGVADAVDQCPNTPLIDLVDIHGCTKSTLETKTVGKSHADIIIGANYSGSNFASLNRSDTYAASLQADYYYGDFSLQASTSLYQTSSKDYDANGLNDSYIGGAYNFHPNSSITLRLAAGAILPTYDTALNNNNTDYTGSLSLSYTLKKINLFAGYGYTMINDDDVVDANNDYRYQNTNSYSVGAGYYFTNKFYLSGNYNLSNSIYQGIEDIKTASLYGYYAIDKTKFLTLAYAYGLSDSASNNALSVKIGYYF